MSEKSRVEWIERLEDALKVKTTALEGMDEVNRARYRQAAAAAIKQVEARLENS